MALKKFLTIAAAGISAGMPVEYSVKVGEKVVMTGGFVQRAVKTGENEITVTIKHKKTGELHTNALPADRVARIHMVAWVNQGLVGSLTVWPTAEQRRHARFAAEAQWAAFKGMPVGTEF